MMSTFQYSNILVIQDEKMMNLKILKIRFRTLTINCPDLSEGATATFEIETIAFL